MNRVLTALKNRWVRAGASVVLLGVVVAIMLARVSWKKLVDVLQYLPPVVLAASVALSLAILVIKSWRLYLLISRSGVSVSFWQSIKVVFSSKAFSPLPGVEFMRGAFIRAETQARSLDISGPVLSQSAAETAIAIAVVMAGGFWFGGLSLVLWVLLAIWLVVMAIVIFKHEWVRRAVRRVPFFGLNTRLPRLLTFAQKVRQSLFGRKNHWDRRSLDIFFISLLADLVGGTLMFLLAASLHIPISFFQSVFLYAMTVLLGSIFSFIPAGLGVTEGGMFSLLATWNVGSARSFVLVVLFRIFTLVLPVSLGMISTGIFYNPLRQKNRMPKNEKL